MKINIPYHEMIFEAARSSGAGGQSVNRTNSKVNLRWNVRSTVVLTEEQKARVFEKLRTKINLADEIIISSQSHKSQDFNKKECIQKLNFLIEEALKVPKKRVPTKAKKSAKVKRLDTKTKHGVKKNLRQKVDW